MVSENGRLAVLGCWHQGTVGAACLADFGFDVTGVAASPKDTEQLNKGKAPLYEPELDDLLLKGVSSGRLRFIDSVAEAVANRPFVLVMHDTPVDENDQSDLNPIFSAVREAAPAMQDGVIVYVTAQAPVGTCDKIAALIREARPSLKFGIACSPENLRLGMAVQRFIHPALPVIGSDDPAVLDRLEELFSVFNVKWMRVSLRAAEMTKHALNAFLAACVTFGNELGNICDEVGVDGQTVARALRLEERVGPKAMLFPGMGFSGGTLARDMQTLRGLGDRFGLETAMLDGIWLANQRQNGFVLRKLQKSLGRLKGRRIAVFGLTYKPRTSTLRRSAALEIIADLRKAGALITAHDPMADRAEVAQHTEFQFMDDPYAAAEGADALVIITAWEDYLKLDCGRILKAMKGRVLIDCNSMLKAEEMDSAGFEYMNVGRGRGGAAQGEKK